MTTTNKPSVGYWIIAVIALIWNLMGVFAFFGQTVLLTDEAKELLTPEQVTLIEGTPSWITIVFAIAVFSGLLGCIMLLIKKKLATPLFLLSLIAVLIQNIYVWTATNAAEVYGTVQGYVMPMIVIIICIFLYLYSKSAAKKGWLN